MWPTLARHHGLHLRRLALPLGGIGTGTVSLGGRGDLRDWELMNVPAKGFTPCGDGGYGHVVLRTCDASGEPVARLCEGPLDPADVLDANGQPAPNHGLPRFAAADCSSAYPLMQVALTDPAFPLTVRLEAFNPLVPGDTAASSLPVAVLRYVVRNTADRSLPATLCLTLPNHVGCDGSRRDANWEGRLVPVGAKRNRNRCQDGKGLCGLVLDSAGVDPSDQAWGDMAVAALGDASEVTRRTAWTEGAWGLPLLDFWDDLIADGRLDERQPGGGDSPMASLAVQRDILPHGEVSFTFLLAWRFPNRRSWTPDAPLLQNHYAGVFPSAWAALVHAAAGLDRLERLTAAFATGFTESDLPHALADAALSNLATLRSQTCFRTSDGHLYGWEGTHDARGSCYGSCTHVWNYEHALAHLFPDLARGMREIEFLHATSADGAMSFRVSLPLDRPHWGKTAADGQLGCIVKLWREWRQCGDDAWLARLWPAARRALAFCWIPGGWDADADGLMEGCQHNTMDVEYCGPNPQMQGWYLAALRAGELIAAHLGERDFATRCRELQLRGTAAMESELWDGAWYVQRVRRLDPATVPEALHAGMGGIGGERLQLAGGCLVDQLVGQACAMLYGLGRLHLPERSRITLESIATRNRRKPGAFNPMRSYAVDDEPGLVMAHYPDGARPAVPFPYFAESMPGFEYTAAIGMLQEGMDSEAVRTVSAVRARHDGRRRNPFSEPECGHHYARSLAAWGVLLAWTGQRWDAPTATLHLGGRPGTVPWAAAGAWGTATCAGDRCILVCRHGTLPLQRLVCGGCTVPAGPLEEGATISARLR